MRLPRPAPTVRLRLTLLYGAAFLLTGAVLLTIGYALVRNNLTTPELFRRRVAGPPPAGIIFKIPLKPTSRELSFARALHDQLVGHALHRLLLDYGVALVAMTLVSVAAGWALAGRALAPLRRITATARRVSGENLGERIGLTGPADELRELADTFDGMLARLDRAFSSQRHFVASASHELRTPLAIMRTEIDVALADPAAGATDLREMGEALRETIDRCERLIEGLLLLARSEAAAGRSEALDLATLAADCVTDLSAHARGGRIALTAELALAPAEGERALLERAIANLIENGIRHNEPGGWLSVQTGSSEGRSWARVSNGGAPIDPALLGELTEPFRRLDPGRAGFGLGLSIVRSVVEAAGGELRLCAPETGGLEAEIRLRQLAVNGLREPDAPLATTAPS